MTSNTKKYGRVGLVGPTGQGTLLFFFIIANLVSQFITRVLTHQKSSISYEHLFIVKYNIIDDLFTVHILIYKITYY